MDPAVLVRPADITLAFDQSTAIRYADPTRDSASAMTAFAAWENKGKP
jgi:hypothetical protein